jgi:hypothetical protein
VSDWGQRCECCGWPTMIELTPLQWWCEHCSWYTHELETQEAFERNMMMHKQVCRAKDVTG